MPTLMHAHALYTPRPRRRATTDALTFGPRDAWRARAGDALDAHPAGHGRRAASYARSATAAADAVAAQHERNRASALRDGYVVPHGPDFEFSDDGQGSHAWCAPGFAALCALIAAGANDFTSLYVTDQTRLSRCAVEGVGGSDAVRAFSTFCAGHGVRLVVREAVVTETSDAFTDRLWAAIAEIDSAWDVRISAARRRAARCRAARRRAR